VTGATGFLGRHLVRVLGELGAEVVALVRRVEKGRALLPPGVALRPADLADPDSLTRGMQGLDAVVANAALVSIGQHRLETLIRDNVQGTVHTLRAAADAGVPRFVFISSATAYRPRGPGHVYVEEDPLLDRDARVGPFGRYALSKALAERAAWDLADERGLSLSTVRPHQVHGAFDGTGFGRWSRRLMGPPVTVFPAYLELPSVYVGDLALAVGRLLARPAAAGRAYNITGEPGVTWWRLLDAWAAAGGRRAPVVLPIPVPIVRRFDHRRAVRELGFRNRPLVEGFAETLALEGTSGGPGS